MKDLYMSLPDYSLIRRPKRPSTGSDTPAPSDPRVGFGVEEECPDQTFARHVTTPGVKGYK